MEVFHHLINEAGTWVGVSVVIFLAIVVRYAFPKLGEGLDSYGAKIQAEIDEAKRLREAAEKLFADAKMKSDAAGKAAAEMVAAAEIEAKLIAEEAEKDLAIELERKTKLAEQKIERARLTAMQNIHSQAIEDAVKAAGEIIRKELESELKSEKLVENSLRLISGNIS